MRLSVVIPVRDGGDWIGRCVGSILPQLDEDMEMIVTDDGSCDGTFARLRELCGSDPRVILARREQNQGPAAARNLGIRLARGEWITFCDADDEWTPGLVARAFSYLEECTGAADGTEAETGTEAATAPATVPDGTPEILYIAEETILEDKTPRTLELAQFADVDRRHLRSCMVRREVFDRIGLLDETMRLREDTEWMIRARAAGCREAFLDEPLYRRHLRDDGLSAGADRAGRARRQQEAFMRGIRRARSLEEKERNRSGFGSSSGFGSESARIRIPGVTDPSCDVSILIPMYKAGRYIREALASITSRYNYEVIVVDDGSPDDSAEHVLACLAESKGVSPVTLVLRGHRGQAASRNDALRAARGRYILYLDADDYFLPGAVDRMMEAANGSSVMVSALCSDFISPELTPEEAAELRIQAEPYRRMLAGCMLIPREVFDRVGGYDESLPSSETAQWVLRVRDLGLKILEIGDVVLARRYHKSNFGRTGRGTQMASYMAMLRARMRK